MFCKTLYTEALHTYFEMHNSQNIFLHFQSTPVILHQSIYNHAEDKW